MRFWRLNQLHLKSSECERRERILHNNKSQNGTYKVEVTHSLWCQFFQKHCIESPCVKMIWCAKCVRD